MTILIERLDVSTYIIPTDFPESDGTLAWDETTLVLVEPTAGGVRGLGYTYADTATARLIKDLLAGSGLTVEAAGERDLAHVGPHKVHRWVRG